MNRGFTEWELLLYPIGILLFPLLLIWGLIKAIIAIVGIITAPSAYIGYWVEYNHRLHKVIDTTINWKATLEDPRTGELIKGVPIRFLEVVDPKEYRYENLGKVEIEEDIPDDWLFE